MQCFPLYSILKAVGKTKIGYMSLDVEGAEYEIMDSLFQNSNDATFNVLSLETSYLDVPAFKKSWIEMHYMMKRNGYLLHKNVDVDSIYMNQKLNI